MELYSKRKKAAENPPSGYRYDLPVEFRNQVWHIRNDSIGYVHQSTTQSIFNQYRFGLERSDQICGLYAQHINKVLCDEHGIVNLPGFSPCHALYQWFLSADTDVALDIIQVSFHAIAIGQRDRDFRLYVESKLSAADAVKKLNRRFQESMQLASGLNKDRLSLSIPSSFTRRQPSQR